MKHLNDTWLLVVAQKNPISQLDLFQVFINMGKYENCLRDKRSFEHSCRHLFANGFLRREKINGKFHYHYDDDCKLREVSGIRFSKAIDCGEWTI